MNKNTTRLSAFLARKVSKTKSETSGIAALTFGDLIYDTIRVDQRYLDGADFSRPSLDLSSVFKIGKQNISDLETRDQDYLENLHNNNYSGYTHEFVTHQWARNRGEEVVIPEKFNQKGYDAIYNGEQYQIKFGSVSEIRKARLENPEIKVRTDLESAEIYKSKYPNDAEFVFGTTPKSLTENIISEGKAASMEVYENEEFFGTGLNETLGLAAIIPVIKNISYLADDKTDLSTAAQNVVTDSIAVGTGISIGSAIGAVVDPVGTLVGAVGGAYLAKKIWDSAKISLFCEEEEAHLQDSIIKYVKILNSKILKNQKTLEKKANKWKKTFGSAIYRRKKFKENKITGELYQYIIKRMRDEYKQKKNINKKLEKILRMNESNRFDFDDIIEEILTPKKMSEYTDAKLPTIASEISSIGIGSGISAEFMKKETNQLLDAIEEFIKALKKRGI